MTQKAQTLIAENDRLIWFLVNKFGRFLPTILEQQDLYQAAALALIVDVQQNPQRKYSPALVATITKRSIWAELANADWQKRGKGRERVLHSLDLLPEIIEEYPEPNSHFDDIDHFLTIKEQLTDLEQVVAMGLVAGYTVIEISQWLGVSRQTVHTYKNQIEDKLSNFLQATFIELAS